MSEKKPEYFDYIKTKEYKDKYKGRRTKKVSTTLTEAEETEFSVRRIMSGHKSNAAFLRQKIVYADLWIDLIRMIEIVNNIDGSEPLDLDEGIKKLWEVVNNSKEVN